MTIRTWQANDSAFGHRRSLDAEARANIVRRYDEGDSIATIATATGTSRETVRRTLEAAGVQMRPPGRQRRTSARLPDA